MSSKAGKAKGRRSGNTVNNSQNKRTEQSSPEESTERTERTIAEEKVESIENGLKMYRKRCRYVAEQSESNSDELYYVRSENAQLRSELDLMRAMMINMDRRMQNMESEITDMRSRSMRDNIMIHNLAYASDEKLDQQVPNMLKEYLGVEVKFVRIHRNSVRGTINSRPVSITGKLVDGRKKDELLRAQKQKRAEKEDLPDPNTLGDSGSEISDHCFMPSTGVTTRKGSTPATSKSPKDGQKDSQKGILSSESSPKRTQENSMQITMDSIQTQLTEINNELKKTIKVSDIQTVVRSVVEKLFSRYQEKFEKKLNDEVVKLREENEKLHQENKDLQKEIREHEEVLNDLHNRTEENEWMTRSAISKANFNEQYSRKNNLKIHGLPEKKGEEPLQVVNEVLEEVGEQIKEDDVLAIHRIPGKKDQHRPIIIKLKTVEAKVKVMKKRSDIKELELQNDVKVKVTDDVTQENAALITRLLQDHRISAAWYFNGHIYGECGKRRIKFDLYDDIDKKIRKR
ncbi:uncharacterized protein MCAP_0864-like [Saccostrea cucullata]|uniref:uncharacterized protein MCAP_0864-like n=1 Tax=Saccostrea cuccullata TaxID=36930 RepID=UPI002ED2F9FC